jgi:RNA polymerase primary sigma factor
MQTQVMDYSDTIKNIDDEKRVSKRAKEDSIYLTMLQHKILTKAEEMDLIDRWQQKHDYAARAELVASNLKLVYFVARKYANLDMSNKFTIDDMMSIGVIGLMKAINLYDKTKGTKFATYAYYWIKQNILRALSSLDRLVTLSAQAHQMIIKVVKVINLLQQEGLPCTNKAIAEELGVDEQIVAELRQYVISEISIDMPLAANSDDGISDCNIGDTLKSDIDIVNEVEKDALRDVLNTVLNELPPKTAYILQQRYGLNADGVCRTLDDIGKELGLSRERVRQVELQGLRTLGGPKYSRRLQDFYDGRILKKEGAVK